MRIICLITISQLFFINAFTQANYQPGFIIKNNGETIHGWIDYRQWSNNPKKILFKQNMGEKEVPYTVDDLSLFSITNKDTYTRAIVTKDIRPVDIKYLTDDTQGSVVSDTVFLRELVVSDTLSLYALTDDKYHFYIKYKTGGYEELIYKVYLHDGVSETQTTYRQQLLTYLPSNRPDYKELDYRLNHSRYVGKDLIALVQLIDHRSGAITLKTKKNKPSFFISGGGQVSFINFEGFPDISGLNYSNKVTPAFGIGMDIYSGRNLDDFTIRFELVYSSLYYNGNGTSADNVLSPEKERNYSLKVHSITPSAGFLYNFLRSKTYKVYAGVKIGYNLSSYPLNEYIETTPSTNTTRTIKNDYEFEKGWLSGSANVGLILSNKFEVMGSFSIIGSFSNYINYSVKPNIIYGGVAYHL